MNTLKYKPVLILLIAVLIGSISFSGCSLFKKRYEKVEKKEVKINTAGKKKIVLDNTNGDIKIVKSNEDSVLMIKAEATFHLTRKELNEDLERIKFKIDSSSDIIEVKSDFLKENKFQIFNVKFGSSIDYVLYVPEGLDVAIDNTNGKAEVSNVTNNVSLELTNGSAKLDHPTGKITVDIKNGKVRGDLDSIKGLDIKTVNGSVSLNLADSFTGKFKMETVNGKFRKKEFDFKDVYEEKRNFRGTLGNGETIVNIETTNGSINLDKKQ